MSVKHIDSKLKKNLKTKSIFLLIGSQCTTHLGSRKLLGILWRNGVFSIFGYVGEFGFG